MCYNAAANTRAKIKYAKYRGADVGDIEELERKLEEMGESLPPYYHVSGFAHPHLLTFINEAPYEPQVCQWGLIPFWVKDEKTAKKLATQTLNARSETIFEKPAFRSSAKNKRAVIYLDAFYEHHHFNKLTYPFRIAHKDGSPLAVAGLWDEWQDKATGETKKTVTIVTCRANEMMTRIHNNPKAEGPRMPVILHKDAQDEWLLANETEDIKEQVLELAKPYDDELLDSYTVKKILGKAAVGNTEEAEECCEYPELALAL